jgi:hypothetical protein
MSKYLGKISAATSSAKGAILPGRSVKATSSDALYFKDSDILGTATSGTTSCKVTITCDDMKTLIAKVKEFKDKQIPSAIENFKKNTNDINQTTKKEVEKAAENAYKTFQNEINQSIVKVNIPITLDLGKSIKKAAESSQSGEIAEIDIKKRIITVKYKSGKDKLITEVKNLCVKESYSKTSTGFECNNQSGNQQDNQPGPTA